MELNAKTVLMAIIEDCQIYLGNYFHMGIVVGGVSVTFWWFILLCRFVCLRKGSARDFFYSCLKLPFVAALGFYGYLVLGITILSRSEGITYIFRPLPFGTWGTDLWHWTLWIENILMFFPLGILFYILWSPFRRIGWSLFAGFFFSVLIECTQLITRRGKFETDDIMNNVFGMLVGFLICKGIDRLVRCNKNHICKRKNL